MIGTPKYKKINSKTRKILIAIFCCIIAAAVAFVMYRLYSPEQNSIQALSSVCMDIICMIIMFILLGSFAFGNYGNKRTTKWFARLLVATIWALFLDFLNWAFDGSLAFGSITYLFTLGSLCMASIIVAILGIYLYSYMRDTHGLTEMRLSAKVCALLNLFSCFITFILALTKTAFTFVDGHYEVGALYDFVTVIPVVTVLYLSGYIIFKVKKVGIHDTMAIVGYILFMIFGAMIESSYSIGTTYVSITVADIFIFVMLQNEIIAQEKRNVEKWIKMSNTDELTGVLNRHAYEKELERLEKESADENFVYISVDVNALKDVNDSYGHLAGDELIVGASECMQQCFGPYGRLYRIGGDEFVAMIVADEARLELIKRDIEETTANWRGSLSDKLAISCGYVTHKESEDMTVREMVSLADKRMYEAKTQFYKDAGIERRKKTEA